MSAAGSRELEFKLRLRDESDVAALVAALPGSARLGDGVVQHNDFFDTPEGALRRGGLVLRLREEAGTHTLTAKGPRRRVTDAALADKPEEELTVDAGLAAALLAGTASPLVVLEERLAAGELAGALRKVVGRDDLLLAGRYTNLRRRLGPVVLVPHGPGLIFEFDRTELPGGRIDREVEVEVPEHAAEVCGEALRAVVARAGLPWTPSTSKAKRLFALLEQQGAAGD